MRKVTAKQIAAMATASTGLIVTIGAGLRIPMMALAPVFASRHAIADDEIPTLEEIVVESTPIVDNVDMGETNGLSQPIILGGEYTSTVGNLPFGAGQVSAVRCALKYSAGALGGHYGQAPGYVTNFNTDQYGWGTNNLSEPPTISTPTNSPPLNGYFLIDGYTSPTRQTSTIWVLSNQVTANSLKISLQTALVNAVVHEWYHSWNPNDTDENDAIAAGNAAQIAYTAGGGDSQNCAKGGS